ncbi:MAG TPA: DUF4031 domain-containing protein [Propionicimonas sp.]|nr:DUF4031 domain-containing protein [Propionicimonas sp.]
MALLIDQPHWPAHGTRFAHLVSDTSLVELWNFARSQGLPARAFDHDHFDVSEARHGTIVAAGAEPVEARELVRRLQLSGLRLPRAHRLPSRKRAEADLRRSWELLLPAEPELGRRLITAWSQPHRHYHDTRHLAHLLAALAQLDPQVDPTVALAAWFHDAVYRGEPGDDERASAELAEWELRRAGLPAPTITEVVRLVLLTIDHQPTPDDLRGAALIDADLAILGQPQGRYLMYLNGVRAEHPNLSDDDFEMARRRVVGALLSQQSLYRSQMAQQLWLDRARENLSSEEFHWQAVRGHQQLD